MTLLKGLYSLVVLGGLAAAFSLANPAPSNESPEIVDIPLVQGAPRFEVDPFWPKPLPNDWLLGEVAGIAVDSHDVVWIVNRPGTLSEDETGLVQVPPRSDCCRPAPPVIAFDSDGSVVAHWGGPGPGYQWPRNEHGIFVDYKGNVWIGGNGQGDHQVLKFSSGGDFLLQIGEAGVTGGSNDTQHLGGPADVDVDRETNEVYVADGFRNKRVIVFDADTGEYKRHWGAYGRKPFDEDLGPFDPTAPPDRDFRNPVHAVRISNDGQVYVADRGNNRVQVFRKDGSFLREVFIAQDTLGGGSAWDLEFSPDEPQAILFIPDGTNQKAWLVSRDEFFVSGSFGRRGRYAGQFNSVHSIAADSKGNLFTAEVNQGRRAQRFIFRGADTNH